MLRKGLFAFVVLICSAGSAFAWHLEGYVRCEQNGEPLDGVIVKVVQDGTTYHGVTTTDANGFYYVNLELDGFFGPGSYQASLDLSAIGGGMVVSPSDPFHFVTTDTNYIIAQDWVVNSPGCEALGCWMTGGGAKFSTIAQLYVAEKGPQVSFGGNVYPGCDPNAGEGGNWNHVDHANKLHLQGRHIEVVECGNIGEPVPDGSTSPPTPYNFIRYDGTGTLKAIAGGKYDGPEQVCFNARVEDRNEPGSSGVREGAKKDRYGIRVFDCASGATLLSLEDGEVEGWPVPIIITDGNLQLHVSSCP